jgi:hypothetical protein
MQSHRGLLAQIRAYCERAAHRRGRQASAPRPTHDGGLMDLYGALLNGATLSRWRCASTCRGRRWRRCGNWA